MESSFERGLNAMTLPVTMVRNTFNKKRSPFTHRTRMREENGQVSHSSFCNLPSSSSSNRLIFGCQITFLHVTILV